VALIVAGIDERVAGAGGTFPFQSLEDLIVPIPTETPMVYRAQLLKLLDLGDLEALIHPRPTARGNLESLLRQVNGQAIAK
jgi:hypothetical protein